MNRAARSSRYEAIDLLRRWEERGLPLDQLLEDRLASIILPDQRDRQLIMSMVYGVIRWRGYLDWVLEKFSRQPLAKIEKETLQGLRLGIFQLLFLDRVPAAAAINETVQALKEMRRPKWITGFVNGVLRSVDRQRATIPLPLEEGAAVPAALPVHLLSHPEWLVRRWEERYGPAAAIAMCSSNNRIVPLCLRVNTSLTTPVQFLEKLNLAGLKAEPGRFSPVAVRLDVAGQAPAIPGYNEGFFQVQGEAAQLVSLLLGPLQPGAQYLDGCAGLGGKTSHLAQVLPPGSSLLGVEPNSARFRKLGVNLSRLRLEDRVTIVEGTLTSLLPAHRGAFDGVLLDVPCSGLGVVRRHPDIRWNRGPGDLLRYQETQLALLEEAAQLVAAKGILVYATCSTEPEENEAVVERFLASHPAFFLADAGEVLPGRAVSLVDRRGFFRTLPGRDDLDGFFGARLVQLNSEQ